MIKICLFAGTTEGRRLADFLTKQDAELTVCVATEYGGSLIDNRDHMDLSCKRLSGEEILRLLEDKTVPKIGLSWHDDISALHRRCEFVPGYFIDIQDHVCELGIEDLSLQKLYANLFRQKINKKQQLSNWEAEVLSDKQKLYAATDAWACLKIYEELMSLKTTNNYQLEIVNDELQENISQKREG